MRVVVGMERYKNTQDNNLTGIGKHITKFSNRLSCLCFPFPDHYFSECTGISGVLSYAVSEAVLAMTASSRQIQRQKNTRGVLWPSCSSATFYKDMGAVA